MRVLITGINGFIGTYLTNHLLEIGYQVSGTSRSKISSNKNKIYQSDLKKGQEVLKIVSSAKPEIIFHLAAQSNIPNSFQHPQETVAANTISTINLLEAVRQFDKGIKFVSVGSSSEYGSLNGVSFKESSQGNPNNPYSISKLAQKHFVDLYKNSYGLNCTHLRPFAIIGPGKKGDAVSDFARGIVEIEKGRQTELLVGDLSHIRDFLDVRDATVAFSLIAEKGNHSVYNVCSGQGVKLKNLLSKLIKLSDKKVQVEKDPSKSRPSDDKVIIGDNKQLVLLGFKPKFSLEKSLEDILNYWRHE